MHVFDRATKETVWSSAPPPPLNVVIEGTALPLSCFPLSAPLLHARLLTESRGAVALSAAASAKSSEFSVRWGGAGTRDTAEAINLQSQRSTMKATAMGKGQAAQEEEEGGKKDRGKRNRHGGIYSRELF